VGNNGEGEESQEASKKPIVPDILKDRRSKPGGESEPKMAGGLAGVARNGRNAGLAACLSKQENEHPRKREGMGHKGS